MGCVEKPCRNIVDHSLSFTAQIAESLNCPRVSLGHFGGDSDSGSAGSTQGFAQLTRQPRAQRVFADLAYWNRLDCAAVGEDSCQQAANRLAKVLQQPLGNSEIVGDRLMYGSDSLMLSKETNWPGYPNQLFLALQRTEPQYVGRIFGESALRCFGSRLRLS